MNIQALLFHLQLFQKINRRFADYLSNLRLTSLPHIILPYYRRKAPPIQNCLQQWHIENNL